MLQNLNMMLTTQVLFILSLSVIACIGLLEDTFLHYEIIDSVEVSTITKRSADNQLKKVNLNAFGKSYSLELSPSKDLFTNQFRITVIHGDNTNGIINNFDTSNFLTGHVAGDPNSKATVHIDQDNVMTGSFTTGDEEIGIEPLSHHMEDSGGDDVTDRRMVAYKRTDIKSNVTNPAQCGSVHPDVDIKEFKQNKPESSNSRHKRQAWGVDPSTLKSCKIIAVADYKFYLHRGQSNIFTTANFIANIVNRVNLIYRNTNFGLGTGYGIELDHMVIHEAYSTTQFEYNFDQNYGTADLLGAFSRYSQYGIYCLAHLFTSQAMTDSVLGLAYIASPNVGSPGGICSSTGSFTGGGSPTYNTGWTSSRNGAGSTLTFLQNSLVTAHGHSWGSEHDPSSGDCAPRNYLGGDGKYLMYAYSVTGEDPNNDDFSSCSKGTIGRVLGNKAALCFSVPSVESLCGNGRIDTNEDCDGGFLGKIGLDPCCSKDCRLNEGAQCSAANFPCCTNCQLASPGFICRGTLDETCHLEQVCDGQNFQCPASDNKPDNTPCLDGGSCILGVCTSFCEARNRNSCVCDTVETSCKKCCRNPDTGACAVYDNSVLVSNGRTCIQGYCQDGNCLKIASNTVERLWNLIDSVSIDLVIEFFKTNIVLCVTVFSLVLYIPTIIGIWCFDQKRKRDWIKENTVHVRRDRDLAHDEDKRKVVTEKPKPSTKPVVLDPSEYLVPSNRRPPSRNRLQPLNLKPASSLA